MYRTHSVLLKYFVPLLLIAGVALALWQIAIPWYVLLVLIPVAMVFVVLIIGKLALSRETREPHPLGGEAPWKTAPVNGPGSPDADARSEGVPRP
jgi:uncharacterized protein (DUF58 family)